MHGILGRSRPSRLFAWLAKAPTVFYRLGLGWMFGHRLLQVTHRGRSSGRRYRTVVEVVRYDPRSGESVIFAGWEGRTDWYRNLQAAPALRVETGRNGYIPQQRFLTADEVERALHGYAHRHRWAASYVFGPLLGIPLRCDADVRRAAGFFRGVAFRPR
jgi:deazaflavin-dependent oxidoreductase (nitroreductase family)